ncbi:hypothetical protein NC653_037238 [Populus alba x Populus x berolinensis]|uniref:Uncharacterized protein n=1 Tax=Populus alba x Populus x berolinensis TaxID=444605 RepID=A0AAD6LDX0_9ROSI|nr:hypothetical protein NC653_037238 [Populus alba x Populus x berolinensis]
MGSVKGSQFSLTTQTLVMVKGDRRREPNHAESLDGISGSSSYTPIFVLVRSPDGISGKPNQKGRSPVKTDQCESVGRSPLKIDHFESMGAADMEAPPDEESPYFFSSPAMSEKGDLSIFEGGPRAVGRDPRSPSPFEFSSSPSAVRLRQQQQRPQHRSSLSQPQICSPPFDPQRRQQQRRPSTLSADNTGASTTDRLSFIPDLFISISTEAFPWQLRPPTLLPQPPELPLEEEGKNMQQLHRPLIAQEKVMILTTGEKVKRGASCG